MKNSQIHKGLKDGHIRDFLALQLVKWFEEEIRINDELRKPIERSDDVWDMNVRRTEKEIEYLKQRLENYRSIHSVLQLVKKQGWEEFDVSDDTEKDLPYTLCMSFLGTKEEHDHLMTVIHGD